MKILITGGAGYIGSFVSRMLKAKGEEVVVADNLTYGHREAIDVPLHIGDLGDPQFLDQLFEKERPDSVMHLAAWLEVGESVHEPAKYFSNNTGTTALLLAKMAQHRVANLVFSSTAAIYGTPTSVPLTEQSATKPDSPYGLSKLLTEMSLPAYEAAYGLRSISLRYFNAAGAALDGSMGQDHEPATHLITNAIKAALGRNQFMLFGTDYPTPDGTCIRDYIHVLDIARAHVAALQALRDGQASGTYNVGTGVGSSNREVIDMVKRISGRDFPVSETARRAGDPAELVADASLIAQRLDWTPKHSDLGTIVESAWKWHSAHPKGYVHTA